MANIRRYNRERSLVNAGFNDFHNMIDSFFNDAFMPMRAVDHTSFKVDILEKDSEFIVEAQLPGYTKDEISIDFDAGRMVISASKEENIDESDEEKNYIHRESRTSSMFRSMYFDHVDGDRITASLEDGILKINVPKVKEEDKSKKIEIE